MQSRQNDDGVRQDGHGAEYDSDETPSPSSSPPSPSSASGGGTASLEDEVKVEEVMRFNWPNTMALMIALIEVLQQCALCVLPLYHSAGLTNSSFSEGSSAASFGDWWTGIFSMARGLLVLPEVNGAGVAVCVCIALALVWLVLVSTPLVVEEGVERMKLHSNSSYRMLAMILSELAFIVIVIGLLRPGPASLAPVMISARACLNPVIATAADLTPTMSPTFAPTDYVAVAAGLDVSTTPNWAWDVSFDTGHYTHGANALFAFFILGVIFSAFALWVYLLSDEDGGCLPCALVAILFFALCLSFLPTEPNAGLVPSSNSTLPTNTTSPTPPTPAPASLLANETLAVIGRMYCSNNATVGGSPGLLKLFLPTLSTAYGHYGCVSVLPSAGSLDTGSTTGSSSSDSGGFVGSVLDSSTAADRWLSAHPDTVFAFCTSLLSFYLLTTQLLSSNYIAPSTLPSSEGGGHCRPSLQARYHPLFSIGTRLLSFLLAYFALRAFDSDSSTTSIQAQLCLSIVGCAWTMLFPQLSLCLNLSPHLDSSSKARPRHQHQHIWCSAPEMRAWRRVGSIAPVATAAIALVVDTTESNSDNETLGMILVIVIAALLLLCAPFAAVWARKRTCAAATRALNRAGLPHAVAELLAFEAELSARDGVMESWRKWGGHDGTTNSPLHSAAASSAGAGATANSAGGQQWVRAGISDGAAQSQASQGAVTTVQVNGNPNWVKAVEQAQSVQRVELLLSQLTAHVLAEKMLPSFQQQEMQIARTKQEREQREIRMARGHSAARRAQKAYENRTAGVMRPAELCESAVPESNAREAIKGLRARVGSMRRSIRRPASYAQISETLTLTFGAFSLRRTRSDPSLTASSLFPRSLVLHVLDFATDADAVAMLLMPAISAVAPTLCTASLSLKRKALPAAWSEQVRRNHYGVGDNAGALADRPSFEHQLDRAAIEMGLFTERLEHFQVRTPTLSKEPPSRQEEHGHGTKVAGKLAGVAGAVGAHVLEAAARAGVGGMAARVMSRVVDHAVGAVGRHEQHQAAEQAVEDEADAEHAAEQAAEYKCNSDDEDAADEPPIRRRRRLAAIRSEVMLLAHRRAQRLVDEGYPVYTESAQEANLDDPRAAGYGETP
jgi:hypothetical protein